MGLVVEGRWRTHECMLRVCAGVLKISCCVFRPDVLEPFFLATPRRSVWELFYTREAGME